MKKMKRGMDASVKYRQAGIQIAPFYYEFGWIYNTASIHNHQQILCIVKRERGARKMRMLLDFK